MRKRKFAFEINWPLVSAWSSALRAIIICLFFGEWPRAIFMMLYAPNGFNRSNHPSNWTAAAVTSLVNSAFAGTTESGVPGVPLAQGNIYDALCTKWVQPFKSPEQLNSSSSSHFSCEQRLHTNFYGAISISSAYISTDLYVQNCQIKICMETYF